MDAVTLDPKKQVGHAQEGLLRYLIHAVRYEEMEKDSTATLPIEMTETQ